MGNPRAFNHFEYLAKSPQLTIIEERMMRDFSTEVEAAKAVVTHMVPLRTPSYKESSSGGDTKGSGALGNGTTSQRAGNTCTANVRSTGQKFKSRSKPGTSRCGRHKLPEPSPPPPEGSAIDEDLGDGDYFDAHGTDLTGAGSAATKVLSSATYTKNRYKEAYRSLWRMSVAKTGKVFTVSDG